MYIKFNTAKLAKEKGFNVPVWDCYNSKGKTIDYSRNIYAYENDGYFISKPTQDVLQKWLREEHKIHVNIEVSLLHSNKNFTNFYRIDFIKNGELEYIFDSNEDFDNYEDALEAGLNKALELIIEK
jgi:hypothetical protein